MKKRKRYLGTAIAALLVASLSLSPVYAQPLSGFDSGIENQREYQEYVFLTGEPILMSGTVKTTVKTKKDKSGNVTKKEDYRYELKGGDKGSLSRKMTVSSTLSKSGSQWIEESTIEKFDETVSIGGNTYKVERKDKVSKKGNSKENLSAWDNDNRTVDNKATGSEFTRAVIYDKQPSINYYAGNFSYRKVYHSSKPGASILVDMEGVSVGYRSNWGETETRDMTYYISSQDPKGAQGIYTVKTSHNLTRDLEYMENQPSLISFRGGYIVSEKDESVLEYAYDISGKTGRGAETLYNNPRFKRLYAPVFADVKGHWAQESIDILTAMKAIQPAGKNFGPSLPITREEFAKALAVISDIEVMGERELKKAKKGKEDPEYFDISPQDLEYKYIKSLSEKGVMVGIGQEKFDPKGEVTNAQAAQILISSLGYESLVPGGNYVIGFADDASIPYWAKDSVYMAKQIGLMKGTENGYFQPDKVLTRAEAAVLLRDYMTYMSEELREDFRERIMNY